MLILYECTECAGEAYVSVSDSVLNRCTESIIRFILGFVLKLVILPPVPIMGMELGSCFIFLGFQVWTLMQTNLDPLILDKNLTFSIFTTGGGGNS